MSHLTMYSQMNDAERRFYPISEFFRVDIAVELNDGYSTQKGIGDLHKLRKWIEFSCDGLVMVHYIARSTILYFEDSEDLLVFKLSDWADQVMYIYPERGSSHRQRII